MTDYFSLTGDTIEEISRLFAKAAIPNLEAFESKAQELRDQQLTTLTANMRAAFEEDVNIDPYLEEINYDARIVAILLKLVLERQLRVANLWLQTVERLLELQAAGVMIKNPCPPSIHWPIQ